MSQGGEGDPLDNSGNNQGEIDGAILSINAKNFFCHDNLEVKFNKNINFIVGRNGSGKSAILTALVVGLGARAAVTNRGNNLQSFIKKGANSAIIEIKIKNSTENAFKHNIYGDVITISRTINASGGSSYKIKNSSGEVISTKHEDIVMICSIHDIQVDNPICVLNQDDARNFHAADAKKKYSLFRKATNMDMMESNYNKALSNCVKAKKTLDKKREAFSELEKELNKLKAKYEQLLSRDEIQQNLRGLQDEYYWSEIAELESEFQEISKNHAKQLKKYEHSLEKHKKNGESYKNHKEELTKLQKDLNDINKENEQKCKEYKVLHSKFQEVRNNLKTFYQTHKRKKDQISREEAKISDLTREVDIATNANHASQTENLQKKKLDITSKLEEVTARRDTVKHELSQVRNAVSHQHGQHENIVESRRRIQNSYNHIKSQLNEINVKGKDNLAIYGSKMVDLVDAIKINHKNGVFSEMPRGPIGSYLKVHNKKWTGALEHIMGNSARSFCVNNDEDSRKLFSLMKQIFQNDSKPSITTSKFYDKVHDVSNNAVNAPQGYTSALNCFQIDDPVISNFLIDNLGMESILMVPSHDEAINFAANASNVPRNCTKIVTLDSSEFYPAPNYRSYGGSGKMSKYLQVNTLDRKRQLNEELSKTEYELKMVINELNDSNISHRQLKGQETTLDERLKSFTNMIQKLQEKSRTVDANIRDVEGGHIKVLTEELNLARQKLDELQTEESQMEEQEKQLRIETEKAESELNSVKSLRSSSENQETQLRQKIDQEQLYMERNKSEKEMASNIAQQEERKVSELSERMQRKKNIIQEKINAAQELCSRIENPRPKEVVVSELKNVEAKLNSINKNGPSKQEIAAKLIEKENLHKSTYTFLKELSILTEVVKKTTQQHLHCALQIQSLIANRVQYCFQSILKLRGYSGSIEINNATEILEIHCTGRDPGSLRLVDTTSSLSGGERSYATVAFIMALWDCMELPFYFLDEFDVFMDNVNRKVTMELLIDHAKENLNRQYVFLTPQDTSSLKASATVTIHKLADPVRTKFTQA